MSEIIAKKVVKYTGVSLATIGLFAVGGLAGRALQGSIDKDKIVELEEQINKKDAEKESIAQEKINLQESLDTYSIENESLKIENKELEDCLESVEQVVAEEHKKREYNLEKKNRQLQAKNDRLTRENKVLDDKNSKLEKTLEVLESRVKEQEKTKKFTGENLGVSASFRQNIIQTQEDTMYTVLDANENIDRESLGEAFNFSSDFQEAIDVAQECGKSKVIVLVPSETIQQCRSIQIPNGMAVSIQTFPKVDVKKSEERPVIDFTNNKQEIEGNIDIKVGDGAALNVEGINLRHDNITTGEDYATIYGNNNSNVFLRNSNIDCGFTHIIIDNGNLYGSSINASKSFFKILGNGTVNLEGAIIESIDTFRNKDDNINDILTKIVNSNINGGAGFNNDTVYMTDINKDNDSNNFVMRLARSILKGPQIGSEIDKCRYLVLANQSTAEIYTWGLDANANNEILLQDSESKVHFANLTKASSQDANTEHPGLTICTIESNTHVEFPNLDYFSKDYKLDIANGNVKLNGINIEEQKEVDASTLKQDNSLKEGTKQSGTNGLDRE